MRDSTLKLNDKTILIAGGFHTITQSLLTLLTEQGSDVALIGDSAADALRFVENLNDSREASPQYGRCLALPTRLADTSSVHDSVGRVAEAFGSPDVLVDLQWLTLTTEKRDGLKQNLISSIEQSLLVAEETLPFLYGKARGRLLFLCENLNSLYSTPTWNEPTSAQLTHELHSQLLSYCQKQQITRAEKNLFANVLQVGLIEEHLLAKWPKAPSIKLSLEKVKKEIPHIRMLEPLEVAASVAFFASPMSGAINGQLIPLRHGQT